MTSPIRTARAEDHLPRPWFVRYPNCGPRFPSGKRPCLIRLSGSDGRGPWRGGGPAPYGHCGWPYVCGSRAPWSADAFWADRYEAWGTPPQFRFKPALPAQQQFRQKLRSAKDTCSIIADKSLPCQPSFLSENKEIFKGFPFPQDIVA